MSSQLIKCAHENSIIKSEIQFPFYVYENFFCPDCRKGWTIQVGSEQDPTFVSNEFNIYWDRKLENINNLYSKQRNNLNNKTVCICHFVGEGSESCEVFKGPIWCLDQNKWRKCK